MKKLNAKEKTFALLVLPGTILYSIFFIFPILGGIYYSFTNYTGISPKYEFVGFANYIKIITTDRFIDALWFNIRYAISLVFFITVISLSLALLLNTKVKLRGFFRTIYFFPAVLSMLTVGLVFNEIFARALPQLGELIGSEALMINVLSNKTSAFWGVLSVNVWQGVAIPTVLFLSGLQVIPEDLFEASSIDGATKIQQFKNITLPFLVPIFSIVTVLAFKDGLTVFEYIMAMTEGGPAGSTESIAMLIYNHGFTEVNFSLATAEAMILAIIVCFISYIQINWANKRKIY